MIPFGGMERSVRQWHELLQSLGLTVTRIESPKSGSLNQDGLIEAILKTDCLLTKIESSKPGFLNQSGLVEAVSRTDSLKL